MITSDRSAGASLNIAYWDELTNPTDRYIIGYRLSFNRCTVLIIWHAIALVCKVKGSLSLFVDTFTCRVSDKWLTDLAIFYS